LLAFLVALLFIHFLVINLFVTAISNWELANEGHLGGSLIHNFGLLGTSYLGRLLLLLLGEQSTVKLIDVGWQLLGLCLLEQLLLLLLLQLLGLQLLLNGCEVLHRQLLLLLLLVLEKKLLDLIIAQLGVRQSLQVQALPTQVQQHQVLLLLLALVNEPGNADVRARLVHLRVSVCALLFPLLLSVLEGGVDGLIGDLICLGFHGDIRADCLLQSAQINLVQQLDHRVELRLCLFDLLDVDTQLV